MTDSASRRDLKAEYRDTARLAGVYRILNTTSGKAIVGSSMNLGSIRNRVEFAKSTRSASALDGRLREAIASDGFDAFTFEVLEEFTPETTASPATTRTDLATLEQLWRERLGPDQLY